MRFRLFRRKKVWHASIWVPGVGEDRFSCHTTKRREAEDLAADRLAQLRSDAGALEDRSTKLRDCARIYLNRCEQNKMRSIAAVRIHVARLLDYFGPDKLAASISIPEVEKYRATRLKQRVGKKGRHITPATVNREVSTLRVLLAAGLNTPPRLPALLTESDPRKGFVKRPQLDKILPHLEAPLRDGVEFAWETGWRLNEIRLLEWSEVYEDAIILDPARSKNKDQREVPLFPALKKIIERRRAEREKDMAYVFTPPQDIDPYSKGSWHTKWKSATEKAGLHGIIFHDLRRSAVRNWLLRGLPEYLVQRITGHKSKSIFSRYSVADTQDLRNGIEKATSKLAHGSHKDDEKGQ